MRRKKKEEMDKLEQELAQERERVRKLEIE